MGILSLDRHVDAAVLDARGTLEVSSGGARIAGVLRDVPHLFVEGAQISLTLQVGSDSFDATCRVLDDAVTCEPGSHVHLEVLRAVPAGISGIEPFDLIPMTPLEIPTRPVTPPFGMDAPRSAFSVEEPAAVEDEEPTGVIGTLREMPVSEIVQTLTNGNRDAIVEVKPKGQTVGTLAVEKGRVVFAQKGDLLGEDAFFSLFMATRGGFRIRYGRRVEVHNIRRETTFLLLEAARVWDELISGKNARPALSSESDQLAVPPAPSVRPAMSAAPAPFVDDSPTLPGGRVPSAPPALVSDVERAPPPLSPAPRADGGWRVPASSSGLFSRFFDEAGVHTPPPIPADLLPQEAQRFHSLHVPGLTDVEDPDVLDSQATTRERKRPESFPSNP